MSAVKERVLLLTTNLFCNFPNGGSRVYEEIVNRFPNTEFHSFSSLDVSKVDLPENIVIHKIEPLARLDQIQNMLSAVSGMKFLAIDIPDWLIFYENVSQYLKRFKVRVDSIVIALHGNSSNVLSKSAALLTSSTQIGIYQELENKLYKNSDLQYGISSKYAFKVLHNIDKYVNIDPANFIRQKPKLSNFTFPNTVTFLGRKEGTKGLDLFVNSIPEFLKNNLNVEIVGPDSFSWKETVYFSKLLSQFENRKVRVLPTLSEESLFMEISDKSRLFVFPSKFDSFNLAYADFLVSGFPTLASSSVMAVDYFNHSTQAFHQNTFETTAQNEDFVKKVIELKNSDNFSFQESNYNSFQTIKKELEAITIYG